MLGEMIELPKGPSCDTMAVGRYNDMVVLDFPVPVKFVLLDAQTATAAGVEMARRAHDALTKDYVMGKHPAAIEHIRKKLVVSITHLLKSEWLNHKNIDKPEIIAEKAVELMLMEVA